MVERQLGQRVERVPARVALGRGALRQGLRGDEGEVRDRGQPAARVALGLRVGAQLLEVDGADPGLLAQLALRGEVVDAANFRRDVKATALLVDTGETLSDGPGRPGRLYRRL